MDHAQVSALLAKAALVDNRQVDEMTIQAWWEILGHLSFNDAMNGLLMHRRESAEYVQPAHIIAQARRAKRERLRMEQQAIEPKATTGAIPMPPNFRQMVAEAAGMEYVHTTVDPVVEDQRRAAAREELSRVAGAALKEIP